MTLDKMGPLLKTALDSFSPDGKAIQSGFKACGLYPWNRDAVNYPKCLCTSVESVSNDDGTSVKMVNIHNNSPLSTSFITYETFTFTIQSNSLTQTVESSEADDGDLNFQTSLVHCSNLEVLGNVENIDIQ